MVNHFTLHYLKISLVSKRTRRCHLCHFFHRYLVRAMKLHFIIVLYLCFLVLKSIINQHKVQLMAVYKTYMLTDRKEHKKRTNTIKHTSCLDISQNMMVSYRPIIFIMGTSGAHNLWRVWGAGSEK